VHEVTVLQYRAYLESMGVNLNDADINTDRVQPLQGYDTSTKYTWEELKERAELHEFPAGYNNPPRLDNVNYILPNKEVWAGEGLNEMITYEDYFFGLNYLDYPVVALNWYQAKLFAAWADKRLPTESEWEFAAKAGISGRVFPWDGDATHDSDGVYRANFRQEEGVFDRDGFIIMAPVKSFPANDFGLYDMAGNVSEWVIDSYSASYGSLRSNGRVSFVTPFYTNIREARNVHRGGSWKSSEFFIRSGVRNYNNKHTANTGTGLRLAKSIESMLE